MVGIILAAGNGVRLKNSTGGDGCKALRKINDSYLIEYALKNFVDLEIDKVVIVVGKQGELIKSTLGYEYNGMALSYVHQPHQKGLINALMQALNTIENNESIVLQLADEIFVNLEVENIKNYISEMACDFYCGFTYEDNAEKIKGNFSIETDENSIMKECTEKPTIIVNKIKGTGFCIFKYNSVQILKSIYSEDDNTPNDLCDFLNYLISNNKKGLAFCLAEREFNINTASDITEAEAFLHKAKTNQI